jgi:hypothetical protein
MEETAFFRLHRHSPKPLPPNQITLTILGEMLIVAAAKNKILARFLHYRRLESGRKSAPILITYLINHLVCLHYRESELGNTKNIHVSRS